MTITREQIERDYPHRIAADPDTCPVCAGDQETTDNRYGGTPIARDTPSQVYECRACEVWNQEVALEEPIRVRLTDYQLGETLFRMEVDQDSGNEPWGDIDHTGRTTRYLVLETQHDLDRAVYCLTEQRDIELDNGQAARGNSLDSLVRKIVDAAGGEERLGASARHFLTY